MHAWLALLLFAAPHRAATVLDDFVSLDVGLDGVPDEATERRKAASTVDLRNGYLAGSGDFGEFTAALFVRKDGAHILAVNASGPDMGCPHLGQPRFFIRKGDSWQEITDEVWPADKLAHARIARWVRSHVTPDQIQSGAMSQCSFGPESVEWTLPREGTVITGNTEIGGLTLEVAWDKARGRFAVRAPAELAR